MENRDYLMDNILIEETKKDVPEETKSRYQAYADRISGQVKTGKED